jgi:hypothetical protein
MLGIEERYVERTARTKSKSFVNALIYNNIAAAAFFLFVGIIFHHKSPTDMMPMILLIIWPAGLRFAYLGWCAAKRQKELNIR